MDKNVRTKHDISTEPKVPAPRYSSVETEENKCFEVEKHRIYHFHQGDQINIACSGTC